MSNFILKDLIFLSSEVYFSQHFKQKGLYIAFEMRYTGRTQRVMRGSLSVPSRVELGIPGQHCC